MVLPAILIVIEFGLILWGLLGVHVMQLDKQMLIDETTWKIEVLKARANRCFNEGYTDIYVIDQELQTWKAEEGFSKCLNE